MSSTANILQYLSEHPFFAPFGEEFLEILSGYAENRTVTSGNLLFHQGRHADRFYVIKSGQATVEVPAISGPALQLQHLVADDVAGWSWLIPPYEWDFQCRVEEDCEVIEFDGASLLKKCDADHDFGYKLLRAFTTLMSTRLHASRQKMMEQWIPAGFA